MNGLTMQLVLRGDWKRSRAVNMDGVRRVAGRALVNHLRSHFFKLDQDRPNEMGGRRTHFYNRAARSVQQPRIEGNDVTVSINHEGLAQRLLGGTIEPGPGKKFLTIPARSEAYGKRAGEFQDLEILWGKRGPIGLVQRQQNIWAPKRVRGKRRSKDEPEDDFGAINRNAMNREGLAESAQRKQERGGLLFFWFVKSVTQQPDPSVMPEESEMLGSIKEALLDYLDAKASGGTS